MAAAEGRKNGMAAQKNVDDLHERGGSTKIIHLHGELLKARSSLDEELIYHWPNDILEGDKCEKGSQLRPSIVWFGEAVPKIEDAIPVVLDADIIIGSLSVNGVLKGNIEANNKVEVGKTGVIVGDVKTPLLQIETGAKFTGSCIM